MKKIVILLIVFIVLIGAFIVSKPIVSNHYLALGQQELEDSNYAASKTFLLKALKWGPRNYPILLPLAKVEIALKEYESAKAHLVLYLEVDASIEASLLYASLLEQQGENKEAVRQYYKVMDNGHSDSTGTIRMRIVNIYKQSGTLDSALFLLKELVEEQPTNGEALFEAGDVYMLQDELEMAKLYSDSALVCGADSLKALGLRAVIHDSLQMVNFAYKDYHQLILLGANSNEIHQRHGDLAYELDHMDDAIVSFGIVILSGNANNETYFRRGTAMASKKKYREAKEDFTVVLKNNPTHQKALLNRAIASMQLNAFKQADRDLSQYLALNPSDAQGYRYLGVSKAQQKDLQGAIQVLSKGINVNNKNAELYYYRGMFYGMQSAHMKALPDYNMAIELQPDYKEALYNRGVSKIATNSFSAGCADLKKSRQLGFTFADEYISTYCSQ